MSKFDEFDLILSDFNKVEERLFLTDIRTFAEENRDVVIKTYDLLLKSEELNIQLKYLILKSIGELKYKEFVPAVKEALYKEDKVRIIIEAIRCLIAMGDLPAFKVAVDYIAQHKDADYRDSLEKLIRGVFSKNQLLYHYDLFYRRRGDVNGIEKSSDYLIQHLPDENIKDLLPALSSRYYKIRYQMLHILAQRPNPLYYNNIYHYFKEHQDAVDESFFLMLCEALVANAEQSKAKSKIYGKLKEHVPHLKGNKKTLFCITLMKLNTAELIHFVASVYPKLNFERKMLVLTNFNPDEFVHYAAFLHDLLVRENNEVLLGKVVQLLVKSRDFKTLFDTVNNETGVRKEKILNMILEEEEKNPAKIDRFLRHYVSHSQDNKILYLALDYLIRHTPDKDYAKIKSIFFSGVATEIKILIIRNLHRFNGLNQKGFMEEVFKDFTVIASFKKDFLFSLLGVMNEKLFDEELEQKILNRVLVMLEEAHPDDIVNFVYFFDKYDINNTHDSKLIIDEFRLIQNTLLKSSKDDDLVRMIHTLIRNIEKKMILKK